MNTIDNRPEHRTEAGAQLRGKTMKRRLITVLTAACALSPLAAVPAGPSEDVKLALRLHLHVGDLVVGDEDVGHRSGYGHELAAADRKHDLLGR